MIKSLEIFESNNNIISMVTIKYSWYENTLKGMNDMVKYGLNDIRNGYNNNLKWQG